MFPVRTFLTVLGIVFAAEVIVMLLLPTIFPSGTDPRWEALPDAFLLTVLSAPVLWWAIIRPLRQSAILEQLKSASIVSAAVEGILTINEHGIVESFNHAAELLFGYSAAEILGGELTRLMPERLIDQHRNGLRRYLATGESHILGRTVEFPGRRKDGSEISLALSVVGIQLHGQRLFTATLRDLTEQQQIECERMARVRQQAAAFEFGQRALACDDLATLLGEAVQRVAEILGVEFAVVWEVLPGGQGMLMQAGVGWRDGVVGHAAWNATLEVQANGEQFPCQRLLRMEPVKEHCDRCPKLLHEHGVQSGISVVIQAQQRPFGVLGAYTAKRRAFAKDEIHFLQDIAIEITLAIQRKQAELRQRERDILRAEQMAAVAQIATGVAHEIRNPLTSIKMLVQANRDTSGDNQLDQEDLGIIEGEIRRMEQSIQTFLDFARPAKPERRTIDLRQLVERTFALTAARAARQRVELCSAATPDPIAVEADWGQIQQVLLNLTINALDAMPQGGVLRAEFATDAQGGVELRLLDSGPGITSRVLPRLFEPFVTSKETGIGLGLVISRRIAEEHGGDLTAHNRPEGGACFVLRLPASSANHACK